MNIHPTAIVSPRATIADDVEIGPHVIIGDEVALGPGCVIQANAVIEGKTTLGARNRVGYGAILGAPPQDFAFTDSVQSAVRIGDGNTIREYVTIHRGSKDGTATVVGNDCYLMVGAHLGHNVQLGNGVVIANDCLLAGYVEVGDKAVLGGGSVFHQFIRIGRMAMISGGAGFTKDIPPYTLANQDEKVSGINVIGLRRSGFAPAVRTEIRRAFKFVYWGGLNFREAVVKARESSWAPETQYFFDFIAASKRGICPVNRLPHGAEEAGAGDE